MPFLFSAVTDLLQALEDNAASTKKAMKGWLDQKNKDHIESWVKSYKVTCALPTLDAVAVLSAIFPDKRPDRKYGLQAPSLSKILGRCFGLGLSRRKQLDQWQTPGTGDLGVCVERTLRETEHRHIINPVTLQEVDSMLHTIAARNRFSASDVRAAAKDEDLDNCRLLNSIYLRLSSREAKWLTRMILKDFSTLDFKSYHVLNAIDPTLVSAMNVHSTFEAAVNAIRHQKTLPKSQANSIKPVIGSKIGRVPYLKGRSVKNVIKLAAGRKMSVEVKYDGEYCQIHIDLDKGEDCIQIFSKSGRDSTNDRKNLHQTIKQSLRIGKPDCKFSRRCILEGEMVLYNDLEGRIMDFHKIRKHISRSGSFLGTELDSQAHGFEHLMIVYYDLLLIDDEALINSPHASRRRRLDEFVTCLRGRAIVSKRKNVDFSSDKAPGKMRTLFATAITHRWEGLVLKPSNESYFGTRPVSSDAPARGWIKLKKDYIPGLGDSADFAVVGAGYNATRAAQLRCPNLRWTHFHLGCLRNKKEVKEKNARPYIMVIGALDLNLEMTKHLNQHGQFCELPFKTLKSRQDPFIINTSKGVPSMQVLFRKPFVLDVVGAGFEKESSRDYFTLRFPRALKVHSDRDWKDSVSFDELQEMAKVARTVPAETKAEVAKWEQQLDEVDRGAKGSHVPWDLSDDDIDLPGPTIASMSRADRRRSSVAPPMIRMDTEEMTDKERRLDSGEVVGSSSQRSYISNWSNSNLPTPPKSSPIPKPTAVKGRQAFTLIQASHTTDQSSTTYSRQALSPMQSSDQTDQSRKRSSDEDEDSPVKETPKRRRVSPPVQERKEDAVTSATSRPLANSRPQDNVQRPDQTSTLRPFLIPKLPASTPKEVEKPPQLPSSEPFLVPKLATGTAEALRFKHRPRIIRDMERTSPDRQTTDDEASNQGVQSTQESLIEEWQLPTAGPHPTLEVNIPNLSESHIILSPDIFGMRYLTRDLLTYENLNFQHASQVFENSTHSAKLETHPYRTDDETQDVVVLLEVRCHGRSKDTALEMLKYMIGRVPKDKSQIFWAFDWRLVEDIYAKRIYDAEKLFENRLIGRFWYGDDDELRWLSFAKEIRIVPGEKIEESKGMDGSYLELGEAEREDLLRLLGL